MKKDMSSIDEFEGQAIWAIRNRYIIKIIIGRPGGSHPLIGERVKMIGY